MRVVLLLLKKDATRLRALLFLWAALFVLQLVALPSGTGPSAADPRWQLILVILKTLIPPLQMITLLAIVPLLVQEDPVVGSTAFWVTRPISGGALLAGKALFVALFLVVPSLLPEFIFLAVQAASDRPFIFALAEILLDRLKFLIPVFALATLTQTFSRFALTGVVLVVSYVIAGVAALAIELYATSQTGAGYVSLMGPRTMLADLTTIGLGSAVILNQYLTRKTRRSWALLALGLLAVFVMSKFRAGNATQSPATLKTLSTPSHRLAPHHPPLTLLLLQPMRNSR